jgi:hypothetical protein
MFVPSGLRVEQPVEFFAIFAAVDCPTGTGRIPLDMKLIAGW